MRGLAGVFIGSRPGQASLGRVAFWLAAGMCLFRFWVFGLEAPTGLVNFLWALIAYNFGGKAANKFGPRGPGADESRGR